VTYRHALTELQWDMVRSVLPARRGPKSKLGDRAFIEAVVFRARTGIPWRDLPERFGCWKTVYNRFATWSHRGYWAAIFRELQGEVDEERVIIDASVMRAHQDSAGGKGGSRAMHWVVHEVASARKCMRSSTRRDVRCTSSLRRASSMNRPLRNR
jgi:transposase